MNVEVPEGITDPVVVSAEDLRSVLNRLLGAWRSDADRTRLSDALDAQTWEPDPEVVKRWDAWWLSDDESDDRVEMIRGLRVAGLDVVLREEQ